MQLVKGSRTRPLAGVKGEVCIEKIKKLWKERKKDLTRTSIVRDGWFHGYQTPAGHALFAAPSDYRDDRPRIGR
jgi:hypothetical protein